ncbi:MAG: SDR family oxidoreductase [Pseudomonadota bacterium]|uniref:SDR family oxidoreductase n=1 Tax=Candidatus Desulfatibia profunda TaxID=2841695 RepID=A0A8J6NVX6_9BACT|nr:SDR family oxidoreductase [Candidatus Desulfatibia profunda]MBL7179841.1 SDR family oxidoreductase [Desulfobacterales bacterium]MBU0699186.1 SDR family oxidoreductase [Pseudomonadota bacterium]
MMEIKFKRALVTGGAGFIGSHLVDALLEEGCRVTVIDDLSTGRISNLEHAKEQITFYQADIRDQELLDTCARDCDIIFHLAAMVSVPQTVENPIDSAMVNDLGTLFVLDAARKNTVKRLVLSSSCAVYGDDPQLPKHETMKPKPQSPYAVQKLTGELNARLYHELYGLEAVCLRYFNVYGPRQDPSSAYSGVISIFLTRAASQAPPVIYGDGNQYRDFVFVKDVVKANLLAASADGTAGKVFNIGTGAFVRINRLWEMICDLSGLSIEPKYEPSRPGDIRESVANIDLAKSVLGFDPEYDFSKGLKITFDWYKE